MFDPEKYFIQLLLGRRQMKEVDARNVFQDLLIHERQRAEDEESEEAGIIQLDSEAFLQKIQELNTRLAVINLKIERTICELTNESYFVMIPTCYREEASNQSSKNSEILEMKEMEFFKKIILHILEAGSGTITDDYVEHFREECHLTVSEINKTINRFVDEKYFTQMEGELALTPLCVAEFSTFLKLNFPDIAKTCTLCKNITIKGVRCQSCESLIHEFCLNKLFASLKSDRARKCPICKEPWVQ